jgi:hypothetical protein
MFTFSVSYHPNAPVPTANAQTFGDGSLIKLFFTYVPQILQWLVQFGVIKPAEDAPVA